MILTLVLLSCNNQTEKAVDNSAMPKTTDDKIKLHKLKKLFDKKWIISKYEIVGQIFPFTDVVKDDYTFFTLTIV